ncbi:MAG: MarR family transcriptional regulator [Halanaerobiaceae bacterium]|jgi:DNA-binding MarR family transcriptional regulator|nr:MarR family transcriptional regulator [Halanaerobiaceae bacterium]
MNISEFKKVIWEYTRKINENTNRFFNPIFEEYGLTMLQARVLMELYYNGSSSIGNLAESIYAAGANISTICKKLEKEGLVERSRRQEDERIVMVVLTDRGNKILLEIDERLDKVIAERIRQDSEKACQEIISGIEKLNDLLQKIAAGE